MCKFVASLWQFCVRIVAQFLSVENMRARSRTAQDPSDVKKYKIIYWNSRRLKIFNTMFIYWIWNIHWGPDSGHLLYFRTANYRNQMINIWFHGAHVKVEAASSDFAAALSWSRHQPKELRHQQKQKQSQHQQKPKQLRNNKNQKNCDISKKQKNCDINRNQKNWDINKN